LRQRHATDAPGPRGSCGHTCIDLLRYPAMDRSALALTDQVDERIFLPQGTGIG